MRSPINAKLSVKYVQLHKQGWLPIMVQDGLDALKLAAISVNAGCAAVEITCRRHGVVEEIIRIKERFPNLIVMVGSVVDDGALLAFMQSRRPDFPSIHQHAEAGADGFVAMLPFSEATIKRYAFTHLLVPGVETLSEAVQAIQAGAHFAKFCFSPPDRTRQLTSAPTYRLLPIFFTGGVKRENVNDYISAGVTLLGGGWDAMLADQYERMQAKAEPELMSARLLALMDAVHQARRTYWPQYEAMLAMSPSDYLQAVPHFHPFGSEG